MVELAESWRELVRCRGLNPSLDPGWMDAAVRSHGCTKDAVVAASWHGASLAGVLPLIRRRMTIYGVRLDVVDLASNLVAYHPEIMAADGLEDLLMDGLARASGGRWDVFMAGGICDDSATARMLGRLPSPVGSRTIMQLGERSPFLRIEHSWDAFLRSQDKKFRANLARAERRVSDHGPIRMQWYESVDDTAKMLESILAIERNSWKAQSGLAITDRAHEMDYYARLLPVLIELRGLFANILYVGERPVAYVLCCRADRWVGQLKTSFDVSFDDAGAYVIASSVRRAFHAGAREYDFLGDSEPHKRKWTFDARQHSNYWVYSSRPVARAVAAARDLAMKFKRSS